MNGRADILIASEDLGLRRAIAGAFKRVAGAVHHPQFMTFQTRNLRPRVRRIERYDVIVLGANEASFAIAIQLAVHEADFLMVDAAPKLSSRHLKRVAERFDMPVRLSTRIVSLTWNGVHFQLDTDTIRYEATLVIMWTDPLPKSHAEQLVEFIMKNLREHEEPGESGSAL
ncbi:MAG: hypothetical protein ABJB66_17330 [Gemmatimonadaceae bacterium]